jgi:RHS repeat-associated protein
LHEQRSYYTLDWDEVKKENYYRETKYPLITWVFEEGTFVHAAKITEKEQLSIATNYLGTPEAMYREDGEAVWTCELNSYGKVRNFQGGSKTDCPFRYQGQYKDAETGLYYNRFRYYSPEEGMYLSQDPIRLGGGFEFYSYVHDPNNWTDSLGLMRRGNQTTQTHMDHVRDRFEADNAGARHDYGGRDSSTGVDKSEKYLPPLNQTTNSRQGSSYTDMTYNVSGQTVHIQTVDRGSSHGMSSREWTNATRILAQDPNAIIITVQKGKILKPGDLDLSKFSKGVVNCA